MSVFVEGEGAIAPGHFGATDQVILVTPLVFTTIEYKLPLAGAAPNPTVTAPDPVITK